MDIWLARQASRMQYNDETVRSFDASAGRYADKYFGLRIYDAYYDAFLRLLPAPHCRLLDLACGPGSVAAYLRAKRPKARIVCADRSPAMLVEAAKRVPDVAVVNVDCRDLGAIDGMFDGIAFCFGLSYFDDRDAMVALGQARSKLCERGAFLLASVTGDPQSSTVHCTGDGSRVFSFARPPETVREMVIEAGFDVLSYDIVPSPENAPAKTSDVVIVARRR